MSDNEKLDPATEIRLITTVIETHQDTLKSHGDQLTIAKTLMTGITALVKKQATTVASLSAELVATKEAKLAVESRLASLEKRFDALLADFQGHCDYGKRLEQDEKERSEVLFTDAMALNKRLIKAENALKDQKAINDKTLEALQSQQNVILTAAKVAGRRKELEALQDEQERRGGPQEAPPRENPPYDDVPF